MATSGSQGRLTSDESFAAIGIVRGRGRLRGPRRGPRPAGAQGRRLRRFARRSRASNARSAGVLPAEDGPSGPGSRRRVDDLRVRGTRTNITNFLEKPRSRRRLVCPQARSENHARPPVGRHRPTPHPDHVAAAATLEETVSSALGVGVQARPHRSGYRRLLDQAARDRLVRLLGPKLSGDDRDE